MSECKGCGSCRNCVPEAPRFPHRRPAEDVTVACRGERFPVDEEFAVVVAALQAGRVDRSQAVASLTAIYARIVRARLTAQREQIAQAIEASAPTPRDAYAREALSRTRSALLSAANIARGTR